MFTAKVFQSGNSQAIRIPKEAHTEQNEFYIQWLGGGFVLFPTDDPWFPLRHSIGMIPDDIMENREQPFWENMGEREDF